MENLLGFRVGNIIGLSARKVPHLHMCVNLTPLCFVSKLWSLPFQPRWFHLIWSFLAKVMSVAISDLAVFSSGRYYRIRPGSTVSDVCFWAKSSVYRGTGRSTTAHCGTTAWVGAVLPRRAVFVAEERTVVSVFFTLGHLDPVVPGKARYYRGGLFCTATGRFSGHLFKGSSSQRFPNLLSKFEPENPHHC